MPEKNKDFALFKKEFEKWCKLFSLTGWRIYYDYKPLQDKFASISYSLEDSNVLVSLNNKLSSAIAKHRDIRVDAKHEAIHLLLARLAWHAANRYTTKEILDEVEEEIVVKLEGLIS